MASALCKFSEELGQPVFHMGPKTFQVPMSMFADNRKKLCMALAKENSTLKNSVVLLQGGEEVSWNDTDVGYVFKQESFFQYLFGAKEPDLFGAVHVGTGCSTLFVPRLPEEYAVWMGPLHRLDDFKATYAVDDVRYTDEIADVLKAMNPDKLLTLNGENSDSGLKTKEATFDGIEKFKVDNEVLYPVIAECRVIKSPAELDVMRYVTLVSSEAHKRVMIECTPGSMEYLAEAVFMRHVYGEAGCRQVSYTNICGSGHNAAVLHYGHAGAPNDKLIKNGDMCLFDMGGNYCGYAADITCSFPANGVFTPDQKLIYNAVLAANLAVHGAAKEGVSWLDMHRLSNRTLLTALKEGGLLQGNVDDMMKAHLGGVFQPHGLGHLIGLDVHDCGGYLKHCPERPTSGGNDPKLRFSRTLQAGMCVTIEPGCYFIDALLDQALADPCKSQFLVPEVINRFRGTGGIRIEDDVIITKEGCENMTKVPRTVEEIEKWIAEGRKKC